MSRPMPPPPPRPGRELRRHPRYELFACVQVIADDHTLVMAARNLSLGGVLLATETDLSAELPLGSVHELLVFDATNEALPPVHIEAEVVRHEERGVAFSWSSLDLETAERLAHLFAVLLRAQGLDGPRRPSKPSVEG